MQVSTWQFVVVSDEREKYPPLVIMTHYDDNGDFSNCVIIIAQTHHLEAIAKVNDANGKFSPVDGQLSAIPIRVTPAEAFAMLQSYTTNVDLSKYKELLVEFKEGKKE